MLADELRPEARGVIADLAARGMAVEMLSGDAPAVAGRVGGSLGIKAASGGLSPADKAARVESLVAAARAADIRRPSVVFVGDGERVLAMIVVGFLNPLMKKTFLLQLVKKLLLFKIIIHLRRRVYCVVFITKQSKPRVSWYECAMALCLMCL